MSRKGADSEDEVELDLDDDLTAEEALAYADLLAASLEYACALAAQLTGFPPEFFLPSDGEETRN